ncbi:MAG TPA: CheR family methyltransferase [Candidatus Dormibacteraeota bacterium]|nr:CheR family methyltransferase [Candidatus Dormibacteraeota bacterium]
MSDPPPEAEFDQLLDYLRQARGVDFAAYKRSTLMRRVLKRMKLVGATSFVDYVDYLQVHPEEFAHLFDTILINVSSFFRDPPAWDYLRDQVVPAIIASKPEHVPIRIWCAGCAAGQEAYSLAMVFAETLGIDRFLKRVKIYSTDVDEDALVRARQGYTQTELEPVPEELREKYFERQGSRYVFRASLRRPLIFGRHDLLQDAPISRLDLLSCRNTLMYFTAEAQERVLARFHYALSDDGYLFLGRAEMLLTHGNLFRPMDLRQRLFKKVPQFQRIERLLPAQPSGRERSVVLSRRVRLRDAAWELSPVAHFLLDANGTLAMANRAARTLFNLSLRDVGKPLQDLQVSYRPLELRSQLERAEREQRTVVISNVTHDADDGSLRYLDVQITPVTDDEDTMLGFSVLFVDITPHQRLRLELERTRQEVETAHEELQSSTEELQSTVEELETTNEELQSSNEELETMNEELESTNSELQALNADLRSRTDELDRVNFFMQSILTSLQMGVAVLDESMRVNLWNQRAEDLWGLRDTEVIGRSFYALEFGLPVSQLRPLIESSLDREGERHDQVVEATTRRGKRIQCRVTASPLVTVEGEVKGVVLLMEELATPIPPAAPASGGA